MAAPIAVGARAPRGDHAPSPRSRRLVGGAAVALALALAIAISICVGSSSLSLAEIWHALTSPDGTTADRTVLDLRIPRTLAALVAGVCLGLSGALIQALTRNPLGDPGILGVDAGAAFFVAIGVAVGASAPAQYLPWAFGGALVATAAVTAIGAVGRRADPVGLTLAGVALSAVLVGMTSAMMLLDPVTFARLRAWNAGSFVDRGYDVLLPAVPFVLAGLVLALACGPALNALGLGDDLASALGARIVRTRVLTVIAVTLLAGSATAIAGPIAFVGLMAPHVARWIVGPDQRRILPLSMVIAPIVLLAADTIGRVVLWPSEVPVGIVTAFVGAPVLIHLVRRANASTL
ncbi:MULTISPECIES: FecCD family ABC transporter permease [unclassified Microbacterium]|uniref:FecCD family ABC transporter permease n=1 Tax=unclassified Microbacterium TaxID=2609290 RepID=UPI0030199DD3